MTFSDAHPREKKNTIPSIAKKCDYRLVAGGRRVHYQTAADGFMQIKVRAGFSRRYFFAVRSAVVSHSLGEGIKKRVFLGVSKAPWGG